jgi:neutral ceramidase
MSGTSEETQWLAGAARRKITPPQGVELAGLGYYLNRTWNSIHDDLNATAIVISDEIGRSVAIAAVDLLYMESRYVEAIREGVETRTGLARKSICINCSHSHNAPTMSFFDGAGEINDEYAASVVEATIAAIEEAWSKRVRALFRVGSGRLPNMTYNRTRKNGLVDDRVSVLRIDALDGSPLAAVVNFHAHPTVFWQVDSRAVSRDVPGQVVDLIERELPGSIGMYLQGSLGDVNFLLEYWTPEHFMKAGKAVFDAAKIAWVKSRRVAKSGISFVVRDVELPARRWTREEVMEMYEEGKRRLATGDTSGWLEGIARHMVGIPERLPERYGGSVAKAVEAVSRFAVKWGEDVLPNLDSAPAIRRAEIQAIRLGDVWFITNPAELFSSIALETRRDWPHEDLFILGNSNGFVSYLPDAEEVDRGSYASLQVPKAIRAQPFTRNAGEVLIRESLKALAASTL